MKSDVLTMALHNSNVDAQTLETSLKSAGGSSHVQSKSELSQCQAFSGSLSDQVPPSTSTAEKSDSATAIPAPYDSSGSLASGERAVRRALVMEGTGVFTGGGDRVEEVPGQCCLEEASRGEGAESCARPCLGLSASSVIVSSCVASSPDPGCGGLSPSHSPALPGMSRGIDQIRCSEVACSSVSNSRTNAQSDLAQESVKLREEQGSCPAAEKTGARSVDQPTNLSGATNPPSATYHNNVDESSKMIISVLEKANGDAECDISLGMDQSYSHLKLVKPLDTYPRGPASNRGWGIPSSMGLRGGGETGASSGGWGPTPPGAASSAPGWGSQSQAQPQGQWGAAAAVNAGNRSTGASQGPISGPPPTSGPQQQQQSQTPQQQSQAASGWDSMKNVAANSSQPSAGAAAATPSNWNNQGSTKNPASNPGQETAAGGTTAVSAEPSAPGAAPAPTKASDTLANYREAIFSLDGWGGNQVNQESPWDVPQSPEPPSKDIPLWKQTASNGTEIWEATLRNGGQIPIQPPQAKTPWGHTPATNIGGTWGEDDDTGDSSNMWTGAPTGSAASSQWGPGVAGPVGGGMGTSPGPGPAPVGPGIGPGNGMWGGPKKESEWGAQPSPMGGSSAGPGWGVGRMEPDTLGMGQLNSQWSAAPMKSAGQWGTSVPPKELMSWGDQSPTSQKRQMPKPDDGTAAWGNPNPQPNKWQEMPAPNIGGRGGMQPSVPPPGRLPPGSGMKDMWGASKNGSWNETGAAENGMNIWMERGPQWNEPQTPTWQKPKTPTTPSGWGDTEVLDTPSWGQPPKQGPKTFSKEMIWSSKQFRVLSDMGFKKEDVENALRSTNMVVEDALEMLYSGRVGMNSWRPPSEEHGGMYDPSGAGGPYSSSNRYGPGGQQQMPFQGSHVLNNPAPMGFTPGLMQKVHPPPIPPQGNQSQFFGGGRGGLRDVGGIGSGVGGQPSPAQLRALVQQIQMAVHAGHLNPQILNQPLAPQTLILLNQLLQHLKVYQQLMNQQAGLGNRPQMGGPSMQIFQQLNKTKQQIASLQSQITTQQSLYVKQQQGQFMTGQQPPGAPPTQPGDMFKPGSLVDQLPSKFDQISLQDGQVQSRLNKWKLDKPDMDLDFSRAPGGGGSAAPGMGPGNGNKPPLGNSLSSPNLNPLLGHAEGAWSSLPRSQSESGWPDSASADLNTPSSGEGKDTWASAGSSSSYSSITDLVPEFKPGEPWKGPLLKTVEEDPTLTPAQFMATDTFSSASKTSPPPVGGGNSGSGDSVFTTALSSSTWSFNSTAGGGQPGNKLGQQKSTSSWSDAAPSDLWGAPKPRGPPPGISGVTKREYGMPTTWSGSLNGNSSWLIMRNLTPQIDGSTLRTLCAQHGPVLTFHLYLNHGIALVRYSSGEEAAKAQGALNSCVLGNTTILADLASESDIQGWLQQLGMPPQQQQQQQPMGGSNWNVRGSTPGAPGSNGTGNATKPGSSGSDTWGSSGSSTSPMWGSSSNSVWSSSSIDRGNASSSLNASLNSFLPGDLLGNESM